MRRLAALALLAALAACRPTRDPHEVRLGYAPNLTHAQALVGLARGDFARAIPSPYRLAATPFNAGPAMIEALFAGELDVAYVGPIPAINGFVQSQGRAIRIVSGSASGGSGLVVRKGSGIETERDLAGHSIAVPQFGGTQDVALRAYLARRGLKTYEHGGSVRVLSVPNSESLTLFRKGQLDAAMVPEPWIERLVQDADGRLLLDERTLWPRGRYATTVIVARRAFLEQHPDLVRGLLEAHLRITEFVAAQPEDSVSLIGKQVRAVLGKALPRRIVEAGLKHVEPTVDPLPSTVEAYGEQEWRVGYLKQEPDLRGIMDVRLLNDVLRAQGRAAVSAGNLGASAPRTAARDPHP